MPPKDKHLTHFCEVHPTPNHNEEKRPLPRWPWEFVRFSSMAASMLVELLFTFPKFDTQFDDAHWHIVIESWLNSCFSTISCRRFLETVLQPTTSYANDKKDSTRNCFQMTWDWLKHTLRVDMTTHMWCWTTNSARDMTVAKAHWCFQW